MIKDISEMPKKIHINLNGPDGNAFYLIGLAKNLGKSLNLDAQEIQEIQESMMSGDYENLLKVLMENFSEFVDLYR